MSNPVAIIYHADCNHRSHYGGGGHPNAAGFRMPAELFITEVLGRNKSA